MKIRNLHGFQVSGPATIETSEEHQLQMLDLYPELARRGPRDRADRAAQSPGVSNGRVSHPTAMAKQSIELRASASIPVAR